MSHCNPKGGRNQEIVIIQENLFVFVATAINKTGSFSTAPNIANKQNRTNRVINVNKIMPFCLP